MDEGLARLEYLVSQGLLGLLTGPSGVGKSALLKRFLQGLAPQRCEDVYCHQTHLSALGLLKRLVTQLGEVPRQYKDQVYQQILERVQRVEGTLLLVFDEAHLLSTSRSCRPVATPEPSTTRSSRSFTILPAESRDTSTIWRPPACYKPRLAS